MAVPPKEEPPTPPPAVIDNTVRIGDSLEDVLRKVEESPIGELNKDGVHVLLFKDSAIRLRDNKVIQVGPNFEERAKRNGSSSSRSIKRPAKTVEFASSNRPVARTVSNNEYYDSDHSSNASQNSGRRCYTRYASPGQVTVVCLSGDDNFTSRVEFMCKSYLNVRFMYGSSGYGKHARVYDELGYPVGGSYNDLDSHRKQIRRALDQT